MRTISQREYLDMCASVVAASVANPYGENDAVVSKCIARVDALLKRLGYTVDDENENPENPNDENPNEFGKGLIGKTISYYDSFHGDMNEFVVFKTVDFDEYLTQVFSATGQIIDIPTHLVDELLANGEVTDRYEIDGCILTTRYELS